ncbi:hypothetical protein AB0869_15500 [Micromonospora vinacea]|uniref:hypothetical protein n=1 Tax=Micromonospora vinacea TaxID=709878 RepID=UPI0034552B07
MDGLIPVAPVDVVDLLGCVVLEPGLTGLLFVDLDNRLLMAYADALAEAIFRREGTRPPVVVAGANATEETLWPHWGPAVVNGVPTVARRRGLLFEDTTRPAPLVVVPDLAWAGAAVSRAAVTSIGAGAVHVERHGTVERWQPQARWLAACSGGDLPAVSPHLLDRFPVRWDGRRAGPGPAEILDRLVAFVGVEHPATVTIPDDVLDLLIAAHGAYPGVRRELALAQTARALARRRGATRMGPTDVTVAAELIGLRPVTPPPSPAGLADLPAQAGPVAEPAEPADDDPAYEPAPSDTTEQALLSAPETASADSVEFDTVDLLHPEDDPESIPEPRSLRWAPGPGSAAQRYRGPIIGNEASTVLRDLAVVPTLFRALWRIRSRAVARGERNSPLRITRPDLRTYRREQRPQRVLVLVLDHTVRDWDGTPGLAPHLRWAYENAAAVSVIEFGHRGSRDELRPERYRARSIVDRRIVASLDRAPGIASPLAAAIDLAAEELRRFMHRGWAAARSVRLVVLTDGRGNVPLDASAERQVTGRFGTQGVDDAIRAAGNVAALTRVRTEVIAPALDHYPHLPADLANALGGTVRLLARRASTEAER